MQYLSITRAHIVTVTIKFYQLHFSQNTKFCLTQDPVKGKLSALKDSYCKIKDRINKGLLSQQQNCNTQRSRLTFS